MDTLQESIQKTAQVLDQIIGEARRRDARGETKAASPALASSLRMMQQKVWVDAHWPIAWPAWPPGVRARVAALLQKLIRRGLQWYIRPIVQQQNEFNQAVLAAIRALSDEVLALRAEYARDRADIDSCLDELTERAEALRQSPAKVDS